MNTKIKSAQRGRTGIRSGVAILVALLFATSAEAAGVIPRVALEAGATIPPCGVAVRVLVDPRGSTIDVSQFTIRYQSSCMTFAGASAGADAPAGSGIDTNDLADHPSFPVCAAPACASCSTDFDRHVVVLVTPPAGATYGGTGNREIVVLSFTAASGAADCIVEWDQSDPIGLKPTFLHLSTGDVFGTAIEFAPNAAPPSCPGLLVDVPAPLAQGKVRYYGPFTLPNTNWLPQVNVCVTPPGSPTGCTTTNAQGDWTVATAAPGATNVSATRSPQPADPFAIGGGDINTFVQALATTTTLTPDQQIAADVDRSGLPPNPADLQKLRRYLVFDFASCPQCATWDLRCGAAGGAPPCPITVPDCGPVSQDLRGILLGDIDGSWPGRFKPGAVSATSVTFGTLRWNDLELVVPVIADPGASPLGSMIFSLEYDDTALEYLGAEPGSAAGGFDLTLNSAAPGTLHGLLTGGTEVASGTGEMIRVHLRLREAERRGTLAFTRLLVDDREVGRLPALAIGRGAQFEALPAQAQLRARPNPFNPSTVVEYALPTASRDHELSLQVIDLSGRIVRVLVKGRQAPGIYRRTWDGRNEDGQTVASGVYLIELRANGKTSTEKVVLLK